MKLISTLALLACLSAASALSIHHGQKSLTQSVMQQLQVPSVAEDESLYGLLEKSAAEKVLAHAIEYLVQEKKDLKKANKVLKTLVILVAIKDLEEENTKDEDPMVEQTEEMLASYDYGNAEAPKEKILLLYLALISHLDDSVEGTEADAIVGGFEESIPEYPQETNFEEEILKLLLKVKLKFKLGGKEMEVTQAPTPEGETPAPTVGFNDTMAPTPEGETPAPTVGFNDTMAVNETMAVNDTMAVNETGVNSRSNVATSVVGSGNGNDNSSSLLKSSFVVQSIAAFLFVAHLL